MRKSDPELPPGEGAGADRARTPAERFDPPLRRTGWVTPLTLPRAAFLEDARSRCGLDAASFERLLHHGGLHLRGHPWVSEAAPRAVEAGTPVAAFAFAFEPEEVPLPGDAVLFDARGVVAVAKPAWLPVQGTRASLRISLERVLRERLGRPGLVALHRLDRATSGVVLFSDDAATIAHVNRRLALREVAKRYHAVVSPPPREARWEVAGWIRRTLDPRRIRFALTPAPEAGARESLSRFAVLARDGDAALLEAEPVTGRTHQLRVHLAAGGTPIAGDALYGGDAAAERAPRLQLHALSIRLRLAPGDAGETTIEAPPPADFGLAALRSAAG